MFSGRLITIDMIGQQQRLKDWYRHRHAPLKLGFATHSVLYRTRSCEILVRSILPSQIAFGNLICRLAFLLIEWKHDEQGKVSRSKQYAIVIVCRLRKKEP